ncbi:Rpn family recombination-promoting nuclease/putative transposase [Peptococcus simiae]|uniref:Rpn family recombination-promoting nuclease/putative transposase n=1 Tax=Peptococcus simiae TaxID=1643805 RepID=UPI00398042AC
MCEPKFYQLTNDLLFHIVMQESEVALKGLVASLLSKKIEEITSVEVLNPIDYSQRISGKRIILDVNARVNKDTLVNIEVQVRRFEAWHLRSLFYAARMAAQSHPGKTYAELPIIRQFSILDYTFDEEDSAFFSEYELQNQKTGKTYTDRFRIAIMDLTQKDLATPDDIASGRLIWADLFNAQSWGELDQLAKKDTLAREVVDIMRTAMKDDGISFAINEREIAEMDALTREKSAEQCGLERGLERGWQQGLARGLEEGMEKGIEKGIEKGSAKSREAIRSNMIRAGFTQEQIALALGE